MPPPILPDITDVGVLTSPVPTATISCHSDSFADLEFAAILLGNEEVDCLEQTLADTRGELGQQKALSARLEHAFNTLKENYDYISQSLSAQIRQNKLDARNVADLSTPYLTSANKTPSFNRTNTLSQCLNSFWLT